MYNELELPADSCLVNPVTYRYLYTGAFINKVTYSDWYTSSLLPGTELPLVESFDLLNDLFPFPSILDAGYPVFFYLHLAGVLFDVILASVLGSSL